MSTDEFRNQALSFPGTFETPHFDRTAFKIVNKRIFATLHEKSQSANIKFTVEGQKIYCSYDIKSVYPVPNKWGLKGWTTFKLSSLPKELILDALNTAYKEALNRKPSH